MTLDAVIASLVVAFSGTTYVGATEGGVLAEGSVADAVGYLNVPLHACSLVQISPSWALTAKYCVVNLDEGFQVNYAGPVSVDENGCASDSGPTTTSRWERIDMWKDAIGDKTVGDLSSQTDSEYADSSSWAHGLPAWLVIVASIISTVGGYGAMLGLVINNIVDVII